MDNDNKSGSRFSRLFRPSETETTYLHKGEILIVFLISFVIAISLWFLVNMGKEYSLTLDVPVQIADISEDMAFAGKPPSVARISVIGEGWNLLAIYRNPPVVSIPYSEGEVNVSDIVEREIAAYSDLTVQKVDPRIITLQMEPKTTRKVAVRPELDVQLKAQHEIVGDIRVFPDSVMVQGARSVIDTLRSIPTETIRLSNVQNEVNRNVKLADVDGIFLPDISDVNVSFHVTEYTEGEARITLRIRNVPDGREVRLNPTALTVRYNVPIEQFGQAQDIELYEAYITYSDIMRDTTGYVVPHVEPVTNDLDIRLRSYQPRRIAYFMVVPD